MELNWSTFVLEIINFLILVWLLAHFLYRPVMNMINNRRLEIRKKIDEAEAVHKDAEALKRSYEDRLAEWRQEKSTAMIQLQDEIANERSRLLEDLQNELEQERQKAGILNQRQVQEEKRNMETLAVQQGAAFSSRLLTRLSGPELESRLIEVLLNDLDNLSSEKRQLLISGYEKNNNSITITSAYPMAEHSKQQLELKLKSIINKDIHCIYKLDGELIAGLHIRIGAWLLQANIRDELKFFADMDREPN